MPEGAAAAAVWGVGCLARRERSGSWIRCSKEIGPKVEAVAGRERVGPVAEREAGRWAEPVGRGWKGKDNPVVWGAVVVVEVLSPRALRWRQKVRAGSAAWAEVAAEVVWLVSPGILEAEVFSEVGLVPREIRAEPVEVEVGREWGERFF